MRRLRTSASKPSGQFVEPKIREHRGRTLKNTGDGFLSEFSSVTDAVRCAIEIQRGMLDRERSVPKERRILFRMGNNLGDVIFEEHDIFGHRPDTRQTAPDRVTRSEERTLTVLLPVNMVNDFFSRVLSDRFLPRETGRRVEREIFLTSSCRTATHQVGGLKGTAWGAPRVLSWLGDKSQRIGSLILLVSLIALYFNVRTYYLQQSVNMPDLISLGPKIYSDNQTASVVLAWFNIGRRPVITGRALLFAVSKDETKRPASWENTGKFIDFGL